MYRWNRLPGFAGMAALAVAGAMGCSSGSSSPTSGALSDALADSLTDAVVSDIGVSTEGATATGAATTFNGVAGAELAGPALVGPSCTVTRSPTNPPNSDGDPVPDSVRVSFSDCVFAFPAEIDSLQGTIDFIDPTPTVTDRAIKKVFTDYGWVSVRTATGRTRSILLSGTRMATRDSSSVTQTDSNMVTTYTFANGNTATHDRTWSFQFTADTDGTVVPDSELPSGHWVVSGNSTWTHGGRTFNLVLSTLGPLHFNPACTLTPRFDSGEIRIVVTRGGDSSTLTIQSSACGQYTVTRS